MWSQSPARVRRIPKNLMKTSHSLWLVGGDRPVPGCPDPGNSCALGLLLQGSILLKTALSSLAYTSVSHSGLELAQLKGKDPWRVRAEARSVWPGDLHLLLPMGAGWWWWGGSVLSKGPLGSTSRAGEWGHLLPGMDIVPPCGCAGESCLTCASPQQVELLLHLDLHRIRGWKWVGAWEQVWSVGSPVPFPFPSGIHCLLNYSKL